MLEKNRILMQIVWSLFPVGPTGKKSLLVQVMAWHLFSTWTNDDPVHWHTYTSPGLNSIFYFWLDVSSNLSATIFCHQRSRYSFIAQIHPSAHLLKCLVFSPLMLVFCMHQVPAPLSEEGLPVAMAPKPCLSVHMGPSVDVMFCIERLVSGGNLRALNTNVKRNNFHTNFILDLPQQQNLYLKPQQIWLRSKFLYFFLINRQMKSRKIFVRTWNHQCYRPLAALWPWFLWSELQCPHVYITRSRSSGLPMLWYSCLCWVVCF